MKCLLSVTSSKSFHCIVTFTCFTKTHSRLSPKEIFFSLPGLKHSQIEPLCKTGFSLRTTKVIKKINKSFHSVPIKGTLFWYPRLWQYPTCSIKCSQKPINFCEGLEKNLCAQALPRSDSTCKNTCKQSCLLSLSFSSI